jgi:hypothetical protein
MAILDKTTFETTYSDSAGTFQDNTVRAISEGDLRAFAQDIADSTLFYQNISTAFARNTTIDQSTMLTGFTSPIEVIPAQGIGIIIVPITFFVGIQYGSAAFATNTTFRFEINNVGVSATNTTIMTSTSDRSCLVALAALDTTTDLTNQACTLQVQTGNPTLGTGSILFVTAVYTIANVA